MTFDREELSTCVFCKSSYFRYSSRLAEKIKNLEGSILDLAPPLIEDNQGLNNSKLIYLEVYRDYITSSLESGLARSLLFLGIARKLLVQVT